MLEPSIDELQKQIRSKYTLVTLAAERARVILDEERSAVEEPKSLTPVGVALEEINEGKLRVKND